MKKLLLLFIFSILTATPLLSQENQEEQPDGWTTDGKLQLLFSQSYFNREWTGGGTSSMAGNFLFNYDFSYKKGNFTWDNKLLANYGLTRVENDDFLRKTSDRLEFNTIAGRQLQDSPWYYSFILNFRTQIDKGYRFSVDPETRENIRTEYTNFLSPAYLQSGPGIMWKRDEDLFFNIAPATARFIFVDPNFTSSEGYRSGDYFGINAGEASRFELGASFIGYAKIELVQNVTMENSLSLYSNYLEDPGNIDIDYLLNLDMRVNKWLSANFIFQAIYDDNAVAAFQIREVFGAGITVPL